MKVLNLILMLVFVLFFCSCSHTVEKTPLAELEGTICVGDAFVFEFLNAANNHEYDQLLDLIDLSMMTQYVEKKGDTPLTKDDILLLNSIGKQVFIETIENHSQRGSSDRIFKYKYNYIDSGRQFALFLSCGDYQNFNYLSLEVRCDGDTVKIVDFHDYLYQFSFLSDVYERFSLLKKHGVERGAIPVFAKRAETFEKHVRSGEYEKAYQLLSLIPDELKYSMPFRRSLVNLLNSYRSTNAEKNWNQIKLFGAAKDRSVLLVSYYEKFSSGDYEASSTVLTKINKYFGSDILTTSLAGDVELMKGNLVKAIEHYKKGIYLEPEFLYNYYGILDVYVESNQVSEVASTVDQLLALGVGCRELNYYLTTTYENMLPLECL